MSVCYVWLSMNVNDMRQDRARRERSASTLSGRNQPLLCLQVVDAERDTGTPERGTRPTHPV